MESWAVALLAEVNKLSKTKILELSSLMNRMGLDEKTREEWASIIIDGIFDTYNTFLDDANIYQKKLIDSIEMLLKQSEELCKQLGVNMPPHGSEELNFSEEKALLQHRVTEYENMVETRLNELNELKNRELEACKSLGRDPLAILTSPLPSMDEIDNFTANIEKLEAEQFKREDKYTDTKCKILEIIRELDIKPTLDIEKIVCSSDDSLFLVTDDNMKWLEEYYKTLIAQKNQTTDKITNLKEKLETLWNILLVDVKERNEFLEKLVGNPLVTLEGLQNEVKRCENLKKANVETFIKRIRDELISLWEKCHFPVSKRGEFDYFYDKLYTENILTFHDIELAKMKQYYKENKATLTLLEKREEYWKRKIELEEKTKDPNRYKNRGGILIKEQKERNGVTKKINEIEQQLLVIAEKFQQKHRRPFLSWGQTIPDIIQKTNDDFEKDKKKQLSAKKEQRDLTPSPSKLGFLGSTKKNLLTLIPSSGTQKRKFLPAALFSASKKKTPTSISKLVIPKIKLNNKTISSTARSRYSNERKKRLDKIRRISQRIEEKKKKIVDETMDYQMFAKVMTVKKTCRSTLYGGESSTCLAMSLPQTPKSARTTPQHSRIASRTPISRRLKPLPGFKMDI